MKKYIARLLIVSQLALAVPAPQSFAASPSEFTPESTMLANVMALQGSGASDQINGAEMIDIVTQYMNTSKDDGREQRLQDALVQLSIFTPDQAKTFVGASHDAENAINTNSFDSKEEMRNALVAEVDKISNLNPAGAQFSLRACAPGGAILTAGIASLIGGIVYSGHDGPCSNGSCPDPSNPLKESHSANVGAVFIFAGLISIFTSVIVIAKSGCV
jgi:hypothetical protein